MSSITELKIRMKKNDTFYFYANVARYWRKKDFRDLVRGFMGPDVVLVQHPGKMNPDQYVYSMNAKDIGFCGEIMLVLGWLSYAEVFHLTPVIDWSRNCRYLEDTPVNGTRNAFEYYFEPVSEISYMDIDQYYNVVYSTWNQIGMISPDKSLDVRAYRNRQFFIGQCSALYKKYIRLNQTTKAYLDENLKKRFCKRTLGVHVRGTDFKVGFDGHPVCIPGEDYIKSAGRLLDKYGYENIFLATDSLEAVELFRKEFGSMLVYYEDVMRSDGNVGVHGLENERKNHHYLLGLEVLRDVYTLAACDSLLAGMSNVSFAAQYIKLSEEEEFRATEILDHGIN